ncbi:MAG: enoyl-CoA hydratase/isomerase family protein [Alphaproteobacteria bacterium]|nr:enoyl-CoA hydratase/isomerase family protein [Alphaproteobacteria bacterium]
MYESYRTIRTARQGLTLTLDRPEVKNAADATMHDELSRILHDVARDDGCDLVVLTGTGGALSSGGDIVGMQKKIEDRAIWVKTVEEGRRIFYGMLDLEKPVIARVDGAATGLGATLVVYSDISVAVTGAKIGDPHVRVGLAADDGGALMWPLLVGFQRAKELLLLGDLIEAEEAQRIGLITHVVPPEQLDEKVYGLAERLAGGATRAIGWTKAAMNHTLRMLAAGTMEAGFGSETLSLLTADHAEAVAAFREKRKPRFTGR